MKTKVVVGSKPIASRQVAGERGEHRFFASDLALEIARALVEPLRRLKGLDAKILLSGHGRLSDTPQDDVRIAIQRSHGLLSDTAQLFDALDARSNFEPIMQSVRDLNKLDDS